MVIFPLAPDQTIAQVWWLHRSSSQHWYALYWRILLNISRTFTAKSHDQGLGAEAKTKALFLRTPSLRTTSKWMDG